MLGKVCGILGNNVVVIIFFHSAVVSFAKTVRQMTE